MTVLYSRIRQAVYSDEPCWPLGFADATAEPLISDTLAAGVDALHHRVDGECAECGRDWPCRTMRLAHPQRWDGPL